MLAAWRDQQLSRCLNEKTIDTRERLVRPFRLHSAVWPWQWSPGHLEAWVGELRTEEGPRLDHPQLPAGRRSLLRFRER